MQWIRRHLKILLPVTVVGVGVVAYLAFAVFGVHTLFFDDKVDEDGPVFASGAGAEEIAPDVSGDEPSDGDVVPEPATPDDAAEPTETAQSESDAAAASDDAPTDAPAAPEVTAPAEPQIVTLVEGSFIPRGRYSGEGQALVLNDGSEQRFLRFENFSTDNGPDLSVYLVNSDANADEGTFDDDFIDLGALKGNIGDQNYEISPDVDLSVYDTVVVWCVRFGSAFTAADLMAA